MTRIVFALLLAFFIAFPQAVAQEVDPIDEEGNPTEVVAEDQQTEAKGSVVRQVARTRRRPVEEKGNEEALSRLSVRQQAYNQRLQPNSDNAPWKRVIYRQVHLDSASNAVLYYPPRPTANDQNLFTMLFTLINQGAIKAYEYTDGLEVFDQRTEIKFGEFLDRFGIYATEGEGEGASAYQIAPADIPSELVKAYYIKEEYYFDPIKSSTSKRVLALCPIFYDDFANAEVLRFPLFWVKYDDIRPYLIDKRVMLSDRNNAESQTLDAFFRLGLYEGEIYKTLNLRGLTLAQYCPTPDSLHNEQLRIEKELASFEQTLWSRAARESIASEEKAQENPDNVAPPKEQLEGKTARARRSQAKEKAPKAPKVKKAKASKSTKASGGRSARSRF